MLMPETVAIHGWMLHVGAPVRVQQGHRRMKPRYDHMYAHRITL